MMWITILELSPLALIALLALAICVSDLRQTPTPRRVPDDVVPSYPNLLLPWEVPRNSNFKRRGCLERIWHLEKDLGLHTERYHHCGWLVGD